MKKKAKPSPFPRVIYVFADEELHSGVVNLLVNNGDGVDDISAGSPVAIYKLVETGTVRVQSQFVPHFTPGNLQGRG